MNKIYSLVVILLWSAVPSQGCDICGCANSGAYFGLMPQSHKSLIGVRYNYLHFKTHPDNPVLKTEETFNIAELYGRFFPVKRVQIMAFVPYRSDQQATSAHTKKQAGMGDITVLGHYNILNTLMDKEDFSSYNHTLLVGGGIKLPTGRFRYDENDILQVANPNFQPGTGSTDFIINAFYTLNIREWGLGANISRKFNTTNSQRYKFGNQLYGTLDLYRTFKLGRLSLTPSAGLYAEHAGHGRQRGTIMDVTGGSLLNATAGIHFFANHWTAGVSGQTPLAQQSASGHVYAKNRLMVQVGWLF